MDEIGGLIIDINGKNSSSRKKKFTNGNLPADAEKIDLENKILIPGIVDMRVFRWRGLVTKYKENFRTLSNAALSGGVYFACFQCPILLQWLTMFSMVDFLKRRGRDKAKN